MGHFARVNNGIVEQVIVAEASFFDEDVDSSPGEWIQTSYNNNIRKNFASIGMMYDVDRDAFIGAKQFTSWVLNEDTCQWEAPVVYPDDGKEYLWNEDTTTWDEYVYTE